MSGRHIVRFAIATFALGAVVSLLGAPLARGFTVLGGTLSLKQRDFRVFNNFTDPEANDNVVPDPSFPGALGAPLAIWKGVSEWGSEPHGDGFGDTEQPGGLGSGGANFDSSWQGLAPGVGGPDDNVISQLSGNGGGVLAFTELPIDDGWRIRFYVDAATWRDGPGPFADTLNYRDIQGIATHEYGHALGLNHSSQVAATMFGFANGTMVQARTLEADDIAGVQFLYGARSPLKPHIATYTLAGNQLTIVGENFSQHGNEVWFPDTSAGADGTPLKVIDVDSQDQGAAITVLIPAAAGRGDVLVKIVGTDAASLSNAYPFDPALEPCPPPVLYGTAKLTSQGTLPELFLNGRPSLATSDFEIATMGGLPNAHGLLLSSRAAAEKPFFGGTLYLANPLKRIQGFQFDDIGAAYLPLPVTTSMVGTTRYFQLWFKDPADPLGVGLSNAVQVRFCP